jgi:hypothetical protein
MKTKTFLSLVAALIMQAVTVSAQLVHLDGGPMGIERVALSEGLRNDVGV